MSRNLFKERSLCVAADFSIDEKKYLFEKTKQLKEASEMAVLYSVDDVIWVFNQSMTNGWKGLFFEKLANRQKQPIESQSIRDQIESGASMAGWE